MAITVIDAPCGAGKTTWAIQEMRKKPDRPYIFVTPFLNEIKRIRKETCDVRTFREPLHIDGVRKIDNFNDLLAKGQSVATTHATFLNANADTLGLLRKGNYHLVLDEVIEIVAEFNKLQEGKRQPINQHDIQLLQNEGFIDISEEGRVQWINKFSYPGSAYGDVERLARDGCLLLLDKNLYWEFSPSILDCFQEITILTYLFKGTYLEAYFQYHKISYDMASVQKTDDGCYRVCPYESDAPWRQKYIPLIHIWEKSGNIKDKYLSKNGYQRYFRKDKDSSQEKILKNHMYNFFQNICNARASDILWTCPKDYQNRIEGKGYTRFTTYIIQPDESRVSIENRCFLPLNARATNEYGDRHVLAYAYNMNSNSSIDKYFGKRCNMDGQPISIDKDLFSLGCLIQWVWRSAIRNGEAIWIYLPSPRMKKLLERWLRGEL